MRIPSLLIAAAALVLPAGAALAQEEPLANPPPEGEGLEAEPAPSPGAAGTVAAATQADIAAGKSVVDKNGEPIGTVQSVSAAGAVVTTTTGPVQIPLSGFGKNESGLVIGITKADLEAAKAQAPQAPQQAPPQTPPQQ